MNKLWRVYFRVTTGAYRRDNFGYVGPYFVLAPDRDTARALTLTSDKWQKWFSARQKAMAGDITPNPSVGAEPLLAVAKSLFEEENISVETQNLSSQNRTAIPDYFTQEANHGTEDSEPNAE